MGSGGRIPGALLGILAAVCAGRADAERPIDPGGSAAADPCQLLSDAEVQAVQGHLPAERVSSDQPSSSFRFAQCFYRTPEVTSSVSVAVGVPLASDTGRSGPRDYWRERFHGRAAAAGKRKQPPKPIAGVGDEAFWVGDPMTGALYVLKGEVFLRLSVGGPPEETQKTKRARDLASYALKRLQAARVR